jgi:valyl-tRNA synthetase
VTTIINYTLSSQRIPVYYVTLPGESAISQAVPYIVARSPDEALQKARDLHGPTASVTQDEDVLDTWFR